MKQSKTNEIKTSQDSFSEYTYGMTLQKLQRDNIGILSYHTIVTVANNTNTTVNVPFRFNTISAISSFGTRTCTGSAGQSSQGCVYVSHNTPPTADVVGTDTTRMINVGIGTVTTTVNGSSINIANSSVGGTITVILTFFA